MYLIYGAEISFFEGTEVRESVNIDLCLLWFFLTATELVTAFEQHAQLRLVWLRETRFDATPAYAELSQTPLAWCALFIKGTKGHAKG